MFESPMIVSVKTGDLVFIASGYIYTKSILSIKENEYIYIYFNLFFNIRKNGKNGLKKNSTL